MTSPNPYQPSNESGSSATFDTAISTNYPEFRFLMAAFACATLCTRILFFWAPFAIAKEFPNEPLYLGWLGLVQAIPALSLAVVGGHVADYFDRRNLLRTTLSIQLISGIGMLAVSTLSGTWLLGGILFFMFWLGVARGFAEPAMPSLEAQIVPREAAVHAATLGTLVWHACAVIAPLIAGLLINYIGSFAAFGCSIFFAAAAISFVSLIQKKPMPKTDHRERIIESLTAGWKFVFRRQILWTAMALDLFAVLFGGAVAMLPMFAQDVLHIGPVGLGFLSAAPMAGALMSAFLCMRFPPKAHAGYKLLMSVFGFGISMIIFALSTNFYLSCVALFASGILDGISVVIRKSILRLYSPDHMRGRVAAVSSIFIGASNELGELESGVAAHYLGLVRSVWIGGITTLVIVASVAGFGKELRNFDMRPNHRKEESQE